MCRSEILGLLGKTLTTDHMYSLFERNFPIVFKRNSLKNGKPFLNFLLDFSYLQKILRILKKNISFIA